MTTVIDNVHSEYGGSKIGRIIKCRGSVALARSVPPKPSDTYARTGDYAHAVAAHCLKHQLPASEVTDGYLYQVWGPDNRLITVEISEKTKKETARAVQVYLDLVAAEMARSPDAEMYVEVRFDMPVEGAEDGEVHGQCDCLVYHPSLGRVAAFDYKHGVGYGVAVEDNAQPLFYATGAVMSHPEWKLSELEAFIVQPRDWTNDDAEDSIRPQLVNTVEVLEFQVLVGEVVRDAKEQIATYEMAVDMAWPEPQKALTLAPGDHCRWCDANAACLAFQDYSAKGLPFTISDVIDLGVNVLPEPKTFDTTRLGQILAAKELLMPWFARVEEYAMAQGLSGVPIPGFKVVDKQGRAKLAAAEADVVAYMDMLFGIPEDVVFPRKLATLTELTAELKAAGATKEQIDDFKLKFTIKESSGQTLVPNSNARPAVDAIARDFGTVKL